ncbi:MAG: ethylbenzene dehydrogenase-related protein [Fidelibacterota bacterium]
MNTKKSSILLLLIIGLMITSCEDDKNKAPITDLTVATVSSAPTLDGVGSDAAWDQADELVVTVGLDASHANAFGEIDVSLAAVTDGDNLYIKATWADATESIDKKQWEYENGAWSQSGNEDRMFFFFDMGENGSDKADCATMCHVAEGKMWTSTGIVDQWHWKAHRTAPIHHADDKHINNDYQESDGTLYHDGGQHGDSKTTGLYNDNKDANGLPIYSGPITDGHYLILPEGQTADSYFTPFDSSTTSTSSLIPGYWLNENADGSRADVTAYSQYSNGTWTVEFSRALNTGNSDDVVFGSGDIQVVIAITDNSGGDHSGSAPFLIKF